MLLNTHRAAVVAAAFVAVLVAACSDSETRGALPSAPLPPDVISVGSASALRGTVITRARHLDAGPSLGTLRGADTATYVIAGASLGSKTAFLQTADGELEKAELFASSGVTRKVGQWTVRAAGIGNEIRYSAADGAPPTEAEYVRNGAVVARVATAWIVVDGGWRIATRTITLLQDGVPTEAIEREYGTPKVIALSSVDRAKFDAALAPERLVRGRAAIGASRNDEGGGGMPCQSQYDSAMASFGAYWAACSGAATACASFSPLACANGFVGIAVAMMNVNRACDAFDSCLAAA